MLELSIVIPTHRRPQSVFRLLTSLFNQSIEADRCEVLVVSNFEDQALASVVAEAVGPRKGVSVLVAGKAGANYSRNLGLERAAGEIVLFLDDDCVASDPAFLEKVVQLHRAHPGAIAIGGRYGVHEENAPADVAYNLISREWQEAGGVAGEESLRLIGGNVSYKRAPLLELGEKFDSSITYGGTEFEFHRRLARRGASLLYFPNLSVWHFPSVTPKSLAEKAFKQAMAAVRHSMREKDESGNGPFQSARYVGALRYAKSERELADIYANFERYDLAYNLVAKAGVRSVFQLKLCLNGWSRKKTRLAMEAEVNHVGG